MVAKAKNHTLEIRSDLSELRRVSDWLGATGALLKLPEKVRFALDVCVAEAVQNVISYAYGDSTSHMIRIRIRPGSGRVELEIEDDGEPFNPLEYRLTPPTRNLDEAPLGGRGIMLIRGLMTDCRYRRRDEKNVFTMTHEFAKTKDS